MENLRNWPSNKQREIILSRKHTRKKNKTQMTQVTISNISVQYHTKTKQLMEIHQVYQHQEIVF